ncbi:hypothetical protein TNCV_2059961 [Trichonephila clavipes]|nr:hypothetical protein TNCV_2059961 [Trichonephila clavipes]
MTRATPELEPPSPNYHTPMRTFQLSIDLTCIAALHGGSFCGTGLELETCQTMIRYLDLIPQPQVRRQKPSTLDYFLWGYKKSLVYANKPQTLDHLEDNIRRVIAVIRPQMLEKVIENWTPRLDYIRASRGSPMPEIIFKM